MKILFAFILFFEFSSNPSITEVRKLYPTVTSSETNAKEFVEKLAAFSKEDNKTLVAYKGASLAIVSKLEKKISNRSKKFKEGASLIEYAVANEPNNIEIRLVRLSVQENVPKIVNYRGNKKEDATFLLDHYKEQTGALKVYVGKFIEQSKSFSTTEKELVQ
ncbi:hypothetical protein FNW52_18695 [Flavobacterium sp. ZT3R18]|uniref:hypothetical protein n=1 Tax=Flavobacterium sp. ZT3R18 TaxID=2594429 RepID=UPI001179CD02|nr:hypothetical protein [Flavobacterium sp. ZT3R18]TRX31245.1 hypothetical protein FNW52_18695 [Flavobacterium sp. ZT3R18]